MSKVQRDYVLAYKVFESSKDFEGWQVENPVTDVITVQPFADPVVGAVVFVVYKKWICKSRKVSDFE